MKSCLLAVAVLALAASCDAGTYPLTFKVLVLSFSVCAFLPHRTLLHGQGPSAQQQCMDLKQLLSGNGHCNDWLGLKFDHLLLPSTRQLPFDKPVRLCDDVRLWLLGNVRHHLFDFES